MDFGRKGRFRVLVNGIPFRMDGESFEEAAGKVSDVLQTEPTLFDMRAQDLGLGPDDLEALRISSEKGANALKGLARPAEAVTSPANQFLVGSGRQFVNRYRGAKQAIAGWMGDVDAVKAIEEEDHNERELYKQLDDKGFGPEDLGEIGTDIGLFVGTGAQGALPMMLTGAALGAADVKEGGEGRGLDMALGAAGGAVGPVVGAAAGAASKVGSALKPLLSLKLSPNLLLRTRALMGNPEAMSKIMEDAVSYTSDSSEAKQIIGRAALDKVQQILARLPAKEAKGLLDPAAFGVIRTAVKKATQATADGVNVFNPAVFEKESSTLIGQLGNVFAKPEQQLLASQLGRISKIMQQLPGDISPQAAERAAAALRAADPNKVEAILQAFDKASSPTVKQMLFDSLVEKGGGAIEAIMGRLPREAVGGAAANVATAGTRDAEKALGLRKKRESVYGH